MVPGTIASIHPAILNPEPVISVPSAVLPQRLFLLSSYREAVASVTGPDWLNLKLSMQKEGIKLISLGFGLGFSLLTFQRFLV